MKNLLILAIFSILLISCGKKDAQSTEAVLENNDAVEMQAKKDELVAQQEAINNQIKQLDEKLKELNPEKNIPLITAFEAKASPFNHFLELQGSVETDENIVVTPEMGGVLRRVLVKEGQKVSKGQLLAVVDDGGMGQQLAQMQVQAELAKTTFERQKRLWDQKIGSEIQFLQAKSNYEGQQKAIASMQQQVGKANVRAPFSGIIDEVITEQGSVVSPGQTQLMRIVNLSDMYITTDVPESYLSDIENGKNVEVFFPVLNKKIETKIRQTGNYINPNNRTFRIEIAVPNKDKAIKPNLTARLKINDYTNEKAIMIPQDIISENADGNQYVYVLNNVEGSKAVAEKKIITTGKTQGDVIEVIEGLSDGDQLIQEGARSVKEGQTVKIITY
ncbi:efflux RND transporter periplasmic adaptor subunit [Cochleicola gelatinilyticus]|uniref:Efflux transporter periplasmic adaptor subunit n=1 Tax=Cochleicola gelatinilyticus TaxID=1763537 RepID=A0A167JA79_9FLAO|nr:efflux RND transporter periplasmic adaptor subunit [Cochleicola gelatinilyticus]OAB80478.1 efflux transporter periplasmic adaptor subunit [Cochleicola gelatinilyticus]